MSAALLAGLLFFGYSVVNQNETQRALFIGNSYTLTNDLPAMTANVLGKHGIDLEVETIASGGRTLAQHAADDDVREALTSGQFDVVILQDQSEIPAIPQRLASDSIPAARELSALATDAGTQVIFFETWGHLDGSTFTGHTSYAPMQTALSAGYWELARVTGGTIAPVGSTWARSLSTNTVALHSSDGSHPSLAGTHLTSLVIARTILAEPLTSFPSNGVSDNEAEQLATLLW